jgi:hypothetical protein
MAKTDRAQPGKRKQEDLKGTVHRRKESICDKRALQTSGYATK